MYFGRNDRRQKEPMFEMEPPFESYYGQRLKSEPFDCIVPDLLTLSDTHIQNWGTPLTGDPNVDRGLMGQTSRIKTNVYTILSYYLKGINVSFPNPEDLTVIYGYITGYLEEWRQYASTSINIRPEKYSYTLRSLEQLNRELYEVMPNNLVFVTEDPVPVNPIGLDSFSRIRSEAERRRNYEKRDYDEAHGGSYYEDIEEVSRWAR